MGTLTPFARGDYYVALENETLVVETTAGILANDGNTDGQTLNIQLVQPPAHGTLDLRGDGGFTYLPHPDFNREDSFRYRVSDGQESSETATVVITVATESPWHNGAKPRDINADGYVSPIDMLAIISTLNIRGGRALPLERIRPLVAPFYDVNRDGVVSPIDALVVISYLNSVGAGEAEGARGTASSSLVTFEEPRNAVPVDIAESVTAGHHVRLPRILEEVETLASLTGFPRSETVHETRIWKEYHPKSADSDLEEILTEITGELDRRWKRRWNP